MEVREHIKSLKELVACEGCTLEISQETVETIKELISLLQQGEKYRQMWEEFGGTQTYTSYQIDNNLTMDDIEQKYFPKEAKQDYPEGEE